MKMYSVPRLALTTALGGLLIAGPALACNMPANHSTANSNAAADTSRDVPAQTNNQNNNCVCNMPNNQSGMAMSDQTTSRSVYSSPGSSSTTQNIPPNGQSQSGGMSTMNGNDNNRGIAAETTLGGGRQGMPTGQPSMRVESDIHPAGSQPLVNDAGTTKLVLNDREIMQFRTGADNYSAHQRWWMTQVRLQKALGQYAVSGDDVHIRHIAGDPVIYIRNQQLLTVTPADARVNNTPQDALASQWAGRLRAALNRIHH